MLHIAYPICPTIALGGGPPRLRDLLPPIQPQRDNIVKRLQIWPIPAIGFTQE